MKYHTYNTFAQKGRESQEEEQLLLEDTKTELESRLVVYNDDVNTFDWVIESFMKVCRHTLAQAEQLSYMVHFNGKATVKTGDRQELLPQKEALQERGISATIEQE